VIVVIGTNDCAVGYDGTTTPAAYAALLEQLIAVDATTCILVSTVPPQQGAGPQANVVDFNSKLPAIWDTFDAAHPAVPLRRADIFAAVGGVWSSTYFSADGVHFNNAGYAQMLAAILAAMT